MCIKATGVHLMVTDHSKHKIKHIIAENNDTDQELCLATATI